MTAAAPARSVRGAFIPSEGGTHLCCQFFSVLLFGRCFESSGCTSVDVFFRYNIGAASPTSSPHDRPNGTRPRRRDARQAAHRLEGRPDCAG